MGGQQDGCSRGIEFFCQSPDFGAQRDVHPGRRFVEDQQPWPVDQRAGQYQPALHTAGQFVRPCARLVLQLKQSQQFIGAEFRCLAPDSVIAGVIDQQLADRQEAVDIDVLFGQTNQVAGRPGPVIVAEDRQLTGSGADDVAHRADQSGLAGPIGPEETEKCARPQFEV